MTPALAGLLALALLTGAAAVTGGGAAIPRRPTGRGRAAGTSRSEALHSASSSPPPCLVALARDAGLTDRWLRRWPEAVAGVAASIVVIGFAAGPPAAIGLAGALFVAPRVARPPLRRRRLRRRDEQLVPWLERVASGLRAGLSLQAALSATVPAVDWPLRADLDDLDRDVRAAGWAVGLARWAERPGGSEAVALATRSLDLGATTGGEVARAVDRVASTLRDRMEAQAELRALSTQARASAAVLGLAPLGFCALLATVEPAVPRILLTTPIGWVCLAGGLGLEVIGAAWMGRIVAGAR